MIDGGGFAFARLGSTPRSTVRNDVGRHSFPPFAVGTGCAFSWSQIACNVTPFRRCALPL